MRFIGIAAAAALLLAQTAAATAQQVGVAWIGRSASPGRYLEAIQPYLQQHAPSIRLEIIPELPSAEALGTVVTRFQAEKTAMIILRSNGISFLAQNPPTIPTFVGAGNHPTILRAVRNADAPEGNITGVTYYLPPKVMIESFRSIYAEMDPIALIVEAGHPASEVDVQQTMAACQELGITCHAVYVPRREDLPQLVSSWRDRVKAFICGNQATVIEPMEAIVEAAGSTPVFSFQEVGVERGALAALTANDARLGRMLAEALVDVVVHGKAVRDIPIRTDPNPVLALNLRTFNRLGLSIPLEIWNAARIIE